MAADQCLFGGDRRDEPGVIEDRFYSLIHPAPNFYSRNTAIHGLSQEDTEEAQLFLRYGGEMAPMIEGYLWWLTIACSTRDA